MNFYICGDTHGKTDINKVNKWYNKNNQKINEDDLFFQLGDWGGLWYEKNNPRNFKKDLDLQLQWAKKKFTLCVIPGNHENYNLINQLEEKEWYGGKARILKPFNKYNPNKVYKEILILNRGEIYNINGIKILAIGGAESNDKSTRTQNTDWWSDELLNDTEKEYCIQRLNENNWEVDYVLSHTCPKKLADFICNREPMKMSNKYYFYYKTKSEDPTTLFLNELIDKGLKFKRWYFGHWHLDEEFILDNNTFQCHYNKEPIKIN